MRGCGVGGAHTAGSSSHVRGRGAPLRGGPLLPVRARCGPGAPGREVGGGLWNSGAGVMGVASGRSGWI